ncbi:NAD(P)H-dependent flavin oxidoreductase [Sciscionella sediminilitoris]|uniref:NAD(P)H-dependent flavin oxidoreductase n=1 Tax=Sciscionella sediminilitoris TaxID=1445613 RepID=UPI0004DFBF09|nr:nitronate monooxygenase [Sciscionella sp. SE31]
MTSSSLLGSELPLVAAPMAGGPTSTALAEAVTDAGGFAFLAGGYQKPAALAEQIATARGWGSPFGVNLFAPGPDRVDTAAFAAYARALEPEAAAHGVELDPAPRSDDDHWADKLALLRENPVPVVSFTFALPAAGEIAALRRVGTVVLATVTTPAEARAAEESGVDGVVVQGPAAGGHSGTWDPDRAITEAATTEVVRSVRTVTGLPIIAAGGVDGPGVVRELVHCGAQAVAVGTLLLRADESGASAAHKNALAAPEFTGTTITRAFTGRPARALHNGFIDRHQGEAITAYPAVHHLTRELRRRAGQAGDTGRMHLWAGTGYRSARTGPAAAILGHLATAL